MGHVMGSHHLDMSSDFSGWQLRHNLVSNLYSMKNISLVATGLLPFSLFCSFCPLHLDCPFISTFIQVTLVLKTCLRAHLFPQKLFLTTAVFNDSFTLLVLRALIIRAVDWKLIEGKRRRGWQRMRQLESITNSMDMNLSELQEIVKDRGTQYATVFGVTKRWTHLSD